MPAPEAHTFSKEERICSRLLIEKLFNSGNSRSMSAFPLRAVYMPIKEKSEKQPSAQLLISVPKKHFRRAVKRNRVKRQVREAYRKHKGILLESFEDKPDQGIAIAFIWMDDKLYSSDEVEKRVIQLLTRIKERL